MKVYELMNYLDDYEAGADVCVEICAAADRIIEKPNDRCDGGVVLDFDIEDTGDEFPMLYLRRKYE